MLSPAVINPIYKYEIDNPPNLFIKNVYMNEINNNKFKTQKKNNGKS